MTFETNQKNEELVTECFNSDKPVNSVNSWSNLLLVWVILCDINMSKLFNTILWYNVLTLYTVGFDMLLQYNGLKWDSERLKALIINNLLIWYPFWDYIMASFNRPEAMNTPKFIKKTKGWQAKLIIKFLRHLSLKAIRPSLRQCGKHSEK